MQLNKKYIHIDIEIDGKHMTVGSGQEYGLTAIDGIESSEYEITTAPNAQYDGDSISGHRIAGRIITVEGISNSLDKNEAQREELIRFFRPKVKGMMIVDYMGVRRKIYFFVRSFQCARDSIRSRLKFQLNMYCPNPYFLDVKEYMRNMAGKIPLLKAPFAIPKGQPFTLAAKVLRQEARIINPGDKETGLRIEFSAARGEVVNPQIENITTGKYMKVFITMEKGQVLVINTSQGEKRIELDRVNINNRIDRKSSFFQLIEGENILKYSAEEGYLNLDVFPKYHGEYLGV